MGGQISWKAVASAVGARARGVSRLLPLGAGRVAGWVFQGLGAAALILWAGSGPMVSLSLGMLSDPAYADIMARHPEMLPHHVAGKAFGYWTLGLFVWGLPVAFWEFGRAVKGAWVGKRWAVEALCREEMEDHERMWEQARELAMSRGAGAAIGLRLAAMGAWQGMRTAGLFPAACLCVALLDLPRAAWVGAQALARGLWQAPALAVNGAARGASAMGAALRRLSEEGRPKGGLGE